MLFRSDGRKPVPCANPEAVKALSKEYSRKVRNQNLPGLLPGRAMTMLGRIMGGSMVVPLDGILSAGIMKRWGTIYNNLAGIVNGDSPVKNWSGSVADYNASMYTKINPDRIVSREIRKYHCYSCVIGCGGVVNMDGITADTGSGDRAPTTDASRPASGSSGRHQHKPEYETVCTFGPLCLNDDLDAIYRCNDICNRSGLDTISAGSTIAFAIECFQNGIIGEADTGGLRLSWGDSGIIEKLLLLMADRKGFGDMLADGVKKAAERIGKGAERFAVHAGGQEPGMHDPRLDPMMGVSFSADPTPGRHTISASVYYNVSHVWEFVEIGRASCRERV